MEPPRPPVTIRDPTRPLQGGGALLEDQPGPPPSPRTPRRWGRAGVAAAVAAVAVVVVGDVRADRQAAERERRLDGVVRVELAAPGSYDGSLAAADERGTVELAVELRNTGPRPITVTAAEQGDLRLAGQVELPAGDGTGELRLTRSVRCPPAGQLPGPEREGRPLVLEVDTPAGPREAVLPDALPIGSLNEGLRAACGYPPLERAIAVGGVVLGPRDRLVDVRVELANTSRWQARLTSLFFGRGLVVLSIDGRPDALPLALPPASVRGPTARSLDVVLGLDCGAILSTPPLRPLEEVNVLVDDGTGMRIGQLSQELSDPEALLRDHAYRVCITG